MRSSANCNLQTLQDLIDPSELDYIIISHTEPDHSGLVNCILQLAPGATVVGSRVALQFLEDMVNQPFQKKIVKNGDRVDLGNGHELEFVSAPNLHWLNNMFSYDAQPKFSTLVMLLGCTTAPSKH